MLKGSTKDLLDGINEMRGGVAIFDKDLQTLSFANQAIRGYLPTLYASLDAGLPLKESLRAQVKALNPQKSDNVSDAQTDFIYGLIKNSGKMEVTTADGLILNSTYDRTPQGGYIISTMDVTDRVRAAEQLAKARIEADAANQAKTDFLANMSHEIRTPLSGVTMASQILQQRLRMTNQTELCDLADILVSSTHHLSAIINDVLDLSKIESGQFDIVLEAASLDDVLRAFKKSQDYVAQEAGVDLTLIIDPNIPDRLCFDSLRVVQCVANLVSNALKFTQSGSVTIAALFDPQTHIVIIHIVDTGIGIAKHEQAKVFEIFSQVGQNTSHEHVGTGLGLSISRKLARLMGGDIKLTSELGKGSIFTLTFKSEPAAHVENLQSHVA